MRCPHALRDGEAARSSNGPFGLGLRSGTRSLDVRVPLPPFLAPAHRITRRGLRSGDTDRTHGCAVAETSAYRNRAEHEEDIVHIANCARADDIRPAFTITHIRDENPLSGHTKRRRIAMPNAAMRVTHRRLVARLRAIPVTLPSATACRPGSQPLAHVAPHRGHRYVVLYDLAHAYASVDGDRLAAALAELDPTLGTVAEIRAFLAEYCLDPRGGIWTGAPASPDLFNLYAEVVCDRALRAYTDMHGITYTRYLDDCTFSADQPLGERTRTAIRACITATGFAINHRKSFVADLAKGAVVITGVGLDISGRCFLPRRYLRDLERRIHRARTREDEAAIHGRMGAFYATRPRGQLLNATERRLARRYWTMQF